MDHPYTVKDRVLVRRDPKNSKGPTGDLTGTIRFIGETEFSPGVWYGVELDMEEGKNDGAVASISYFEAPKNRGLFVRLEKISPTC